MCQRIVEKIRIEGHTDNIPITKRLAKQWYNQTNLRLSSARALSVVEFWSSNSCNQYNLPLELKQEWFTTVGIGEFSPIADNKTPEGRRKNRRVEVFIDANIEIVPMVSSGIVKIYGINPNTYITPENDSYWVIGSERRSSWTKEVPEDNLIIDGKWWDLSKPNQLQISLDAKVAKDFNIKLGDIFTLNIYGREIDGEIVNFRQVDYRDLNINFAMLFNPDFAKNIPHEYLATTKFYNLNKFDETKMLEIFPSLSMIKIADYLNKVTNVLNKVFIAVIVISTVTIVIGLIVISSAIMVQGKVREYQNLVFKILGFSRKEIIFSSLIEFMIIFISVIMIAVLFAVVGSKFIIENIFELFWKFDLKVLIYLGLSIGLVTLVLILLTNIKYLNPKVYPLIRNQ